MLPRVCISRCVSSISFTFFTICSGTRLVLFSSPSFRNRIGTLSPYTKSAWCRQLRTAGALIVPKCRSVLRPLTCRCSRRILQATRPPIYPARTRRGNGRVLRGLDKAQAYSKCWYEANSTGPLHHCQMSQRTCQRMRAVMAIAA